MPPPPYQVKGAIMTDSKTRINKTRHHTARTTEADLREQIRTLCELYGWLMYFTWNSRHSPSGFPDLVLAQPEYRRLIYAELKSDEGRLTKHQAEWIEALRACGQAVYVWRPEDITEIARLLQPQGNRNRKQEANQ